MKQIDMNPTALRVAAWSGIVFVAVVVIGLVVVAGFIPPPSPSDNAEVIASWYRENTTSIRIGLLISVISVPLMASWGASIAVWTRRSEKEFPILTYIQLICLGFMITISVLDAMTWAVASFRPDVVSDDITLVLNDVGWFFFLWTWPPFSLWLLAIGLGIIWDKSATPAFPRWVAYYNFWVAFLLIPAGAMIFFKSGPLGFNGAIAFWIPTLVFFSYILVMTAALLRAISAHLSREQAHIAEPSALHDESGRV